MGAIAIDRVPKTDSVTVYHAVPRAGSPAGPGPTRASPASDRPVSFDAGPGRARIRSCAVATSRGCYARRDRVPAPTEGCQRHGCPPEQGASGNPGRARDACRAHPRSGESTLPGLPDCRTVFAGQRGGEPPGRVGPPGSRSSAAGAAPRCAATLVRPTSARSTSFGTTAHLGLAPAVRVGDGLMRLSFDPEDPPEDPPAECVSPTVWWLSYRLHHSHQLGDAGRCACGDPFPCSARRLAERGFLAALGANTESGPADLIDRLTQGELLPKAVPPDVRRRHGPPPTKSRHRNHL